MVSLPALFVKYIITKNNPPLPVPLSPLKGRRGDEGGDGEGVSLSSPAGRRGPGRATVLSVKRVAMGFGL